MDWWRYLLDAAKEELACLYEGGLNEGNGEYRDDMRLLRRGFGAGLDVMEKTKPESGETAEAYIARLETLLEGMKAGALINTLRREYVGMPKVN